MLLSFENIDLEYYTRLLNNGISLEHERATNLASKCVLTIIEDVSKDVQGSVLLLLPLLHDTGSQPEVMIWRADPFGSRTALVIIRCTLTAQRCVDDILRNVALSWPYFSEGKTSLHAVRFSMNCFMAFETLLGQPDRQISLQWSMSGT
ncbi:hypothetical protein TNCV_2402161 [Trichonephila clavipes]|nr:hypothetical protein TNCV_2402161 [Trichonephila clavipes]